MAVKFSVVIPLYNKQDTIERTLRSVDCQRCRDFEVVVVDDGSKDKGAEIVKSFRTSCPLKLVTQENAGVSAARNRGVAESSGEYILPLDADDELHPDALTEALTILSKYPKAGVLGYKMRQATGKNVWWWRLGSRIRKTDFRNEWYVVTPVCTGSILVRRDLFDTVGGYDRRFSMHEDDLFMLRLAEKSDFFVSSRDLARYNNDAHERLTARCVRVEELPQYSYIEDKARQGEDGNFLRFAKKWICHLRDENVRHGCYERNENILNVYPTLGALGELARYTHEQDISFWQRCCILMRCSFWRFQYFLMSEF